MITVLVLPAVLGLLAVPEPSELTVDWLAGLETRVVIGRSFAVVAVMLDCCG